jgi:DNA-binding XRE family transcriptional regulator
MEYTLIRAIAGDERLVIVSEILFDRLTNLASEAVNEQTLADWVNSQENRNALPIALADRLVRGEAPLRFYRELRGLSVSALAHAAGLPEDYVLAIECGLQEETLSARRSIAEVLKVTMDDLEPVH